MVQLIRRYRPHGELAILTAIIWLGLALRLLKLGTMSYWFDEAISLSIARADYGVILTNAIRSSHPPLYYLLLKWWLSLGTGTGEAIVRLPSAILSTAAIPAVYMLSRTLFPQQRNIGSISALLLAIAPFPIVYAQEARMYALQLVLVPLMLIAFYRAWRQGQYRWWVCFVIASILSAYTQYFTFLLIGSLHFVILLDRARLKARWRQLMLADLSIIVLFLPQVFVFLGQIGIALGSDWVAPDPVYLIRTLHMLILSYSLPSWAVAVGFFVTLSLAVIVTYQMMLALRQGEHHAERLALLLVLMTLWLPLLLVTALALVKPFFLPFRSLTVVLPPYIVLLAYGAERAELRAPQPALYAVLGVLIFLSLGNYFFAPQFAKPPYRDVAALIGEKAEADDIEVHSSDGSYLPFLHYEQPIPNYLLTGDPDARKPESVYALMGGETLDPQEALDQGKRIWLVVAREHSLDYQQEMLEWFQARRRVLEEYNVGGIEVYLLDR